MPAEAARAVSSSRRGRLRGLVVDRAIPRVRGPCTMNVEFINPFLLATAAVFENMLSVEVRRQTPYVRKALERDIELPIKVAVMGCVVNGPGEAEGADVAIFAGDRRGIIYVQGEKVANVPEEQILDRLLEECCAFQEKVRRGEAKLGEKKVDILPPDPIGELGSGWEKIQREKSTALPVVR